MNPIFWVKEQKCVIGRGIQEEVIQEEMKTLNHSFQSRKPFNESVKPLSRNGHPNMTQNEDVYAICCQREVAGDVISGGNVKTI